VIIQSSTLNAGDIASNEFDDKAVTFEVREGKRRLEPFTNEAGNKEGAAKLNHVSGGAFSLTSRSAVFLLNNIMIC
jgi:hypothetical protein